LSGDAASGRGAGALYAVLAYGVWGFAPIYWKALQPFPAPELLAYRVIASLGVAVLMLFALGAWRELGAALRSFRSAACGVAAGLLLGLNWLVFIWAVQNGRILATSLGYYINPLVNVLLGLLILRERLSRVQALAVGIAAVGVAMQTAEQGELPWVSLVLATSFGLYGLVRKIGPATPLIGFGIETLTLGPLAAAYIGHLDGRAATVPGASGGMQLLVASSGLITALPLLAFANAAKRLPLSTLGLFQYLAPTLTFLLAVAVYGEPFTRGRAVSFACVWVALALGMWETLTRAPRVAVAAAGRS
jgi:chloramphenicol-sensitive protein RarD